MWNFDNQMTGDVMHLISNKETEKLDSLKVLGNTFIASKDTIGTGYNQVKGLNLYGKFRDNKLYEVDVVKNTEVIYYMRNENQELIGINKSKSSSINMTLDGNQIDTITFIKQVEGEVYPEAELPENARKLRGFIWRGEERIKSKEDIFPPEENEYNEKMMEEKSRRCHGSSALGSETRNVRRSSNGRKERKEKRQLEYCVVRITLYQLPIPFYHNERRFP
ncbi:hypothetical protein [Flavobacterium piscinae]|uniref:hypothetical protein n=1 Tax=Flavobacterium piscinae TaxID=2506424 RepID=UPI002AAAB616|nr:hypothetical protein [Flavobacterium piscinae]